MVKGKLLKTFEIQNFKSLLASISISKISRGFHVQTLILLSLIQTIIEKLKKDNTERYLILQEDLLAIIL